MNLSDLPLFAQEGRLNKHWSVSELTTQIRSVVEPAFTHVWVKGEVSNYRPVASGHVYFSLKDSGETLSAAVFGWGASQKKREKKFDLKDGVQVLCHGKISLYPPRGSYQLIADHIEPIGAGALQLAFEQLKSKLAAEGLFNANKKRSLPRYPSQIAVITSPTGAVIQDMLNILSRRAPHLRVVIIPAVVQGDEAAKYLIRGLETANRMNLGEVIVLARGGGSIEDLWCFNDENLARAIAVSQIPVISAVGHEIDFTISDFVSDLRAPTPSAAAELVSSHWVDSISQMREFRQRLDGAMLRNLTLRNTLLGHISARLISPKDRLREQTQRCDELWARLGRGIHLRLERRNALLKQWSSQMEALSPLKVLERGYSIVQLGDKIVRSANEVIAGQELSIGFYDGKKPVRAI